MPEMQAGASYVEVLPSLKGFQDRIKRAVTGKQVDVDVSPKVNQGDLIKAKQQVENAASAVAKARQKEADAAGAVRTAESRLDQLRESGKARADQIVAAEERVEKARRASSAASEALNRAEGAQRTATRKVERIEADLKVNTSEGEGEVSGFVARAKAALGALRGKVDVDTGAGEVEVAGFGGRIRNALSAAGGAGGTAAGGGILSGLAGKAAAIGLAGVGIGGALAAGVAQAMDVSAARAKLSAQLGLSADDSARYGRVAGSLYSQAYGENLEQVNDALRAVTQNIGRLDDPALQRVSGKVLDLASAFGVDLQGATAAVGTMLKNGLAPNADVALDIITRGFQGGVDKAGDLLDTMTEYSTLFRNVGLDGQTAMGLLQQGLQGGARDADKVADAIKEFSIRAVDGSKTTAQGFQMIGLNAGEMASKIAKGGPEAAGALDLTLDRLRAMPDPVKRSQAAVALFGTQAEDLGNALYALDPSTATNALGQVGGAADRMGQSLHETASARIESFKRSLQTGIVDFIGGTVLPVFDVLGKIGSGIFGAAWGPVRDFLGFLAGTGGTIAIVIGVIAAATWAWTAASTALAGSFLMNPITWIVAAIIGLVAVIIYAYKNFEWFRGIVDAVGQFFVWIWQNVLSPFVGFLVGVFSAAISWIGDNWSWLSTVLLIVMGPIGWIILAFTTFRDVTMAVVTAIGQFFVWLWTAVLWPVLSAIGTALAYLGLAIFTILVTPFVLAWNIIAGIASWAWSAVLSPILYGAIVPALQWVGSIFTWLWANVVVPAWQGIAAAALWAWGIVQAIWYGAFVPALQFIGAIMNWLWLNVVVPAWNGIVAAVLWAWGIVQAIWYGALVPALQFVGSIFNWLWLNVIVPVWNGIVSAISVAWGVIQGVFNTGKAAVDGVGRAFQSVADWIARAWGSIREAARAPIEFVVDFVYNNGIRRVWNGMAGLFGMAQLPEVHFAEGGVLDGYAPGRDSVPALLSRGEGILVPEAVRGLGRGFVGWANSFFSGGRSRGGAGTPQQGYSRGGVVRRYAGGGIVDGIGDFLSGAGDFFGDLFSDPAAAVRKAFSSVLDLGSRIPGIGAWTDGLKRLPGKAIDGVIAKVKSWVDSLASMGAGAGGGVQRWSGVVLQALGMVHQPASLLGVVLRRMNQESGGNPMAINNWDSNAAKGIPSKGLMQVIDPTFNANAGPLRGLGIWNPLANVYASMVYAMRRYGSLAAAYNRAGGYARGGVVPGTGRSDSVTARVTPGERILTTRQTVAFEQLTGALDRGELTGLADSVKVVRATLGDLRTQLAALTTAAQTPATKTITEPTQLAVVAREALDAMNRGGKIFEDFSFTGMSAFAETLNEKLADGFYVNGQQFDGSARTQAAVRRYLEGVAGQTTTRVEPVGPATTASPGASVGPAVSRAQVESLQPARTGDGITVNVYAAENHDTDRIADDVIRKIDFYGSIR